MAAVALGLCVLLLAGCGRVGFVAAPAGDAELGDADELGDANELGDASDAHVNGACPAFATFCDGFETGDLSKWTTSVVQGGGTLAVSTTRVRSGAFALEAHVAPAPADGDRAAPLLRIPTRSTGVLAARQWINLGLPLRDFNVVLQFDNIGTAQYATATGNFSSQWVSTEGSNAGQTDHHSTIATPPLDTWTCVELVVSFADPGPRRIEIYVNGARIIDVTPLDPAPAYDAFRVGIPRGDMAGFHIFVDDVAVADQRIGCD
jgi:hypothetical protein